MTRVIEEGIMAPDGGPEVAANFIHRSEPLVTEEVLLAE
jgi:hypothetical protein